MTYLVFRIFDRRGYYVGETWRRGDVRSYPLYEHASKKEAFATAQRWANNDNGNDEGFSVFVAKVTKSGAKILAHYFSLDYGLIPGEEEDNRGDRIWAVEIRRRGGEFYPVAKYASIELAEEAVHSLRKNLRLLCEGAKVRLVKVP
jgi:hypothetical protein